MPEKPSNNATLRSIDEIETQLQQLMQQEHDLRRRKRELSEELTRRVRGLIQERGIPAGLQHDAEEA